MVALMDADEALAVVADERQQVGLLRVVHIQVAVGEEDHGVKGIQILGTPLEGLLGDGRAVGPEIGIPSPRASPQVVERDHGGGDRLVLIALALADEQQVPLLLLREGRARPDPGRSAQAARVASHLIRVSQMPLPVMIADSDQARA